MQSLEWKEMIPSITGGSKPIDTDGISKFHFKWKMFFPPSYLERRKFAIFVFEVSQEFKLEVILFWVLET